MVQKIPHLESIVTSLVLGLLDQVLEALEVVLVVNNGRVNLHNQNC